MFNFSKKNKNEPESLREVLDCLKKLESEYDNIYRELSALRERGKKDLQKVGMVRFNPFPEVGSDQSFSVAVLDENGDGFVLTSHYLRDSNRVYAKPVAGGKSKYQLSKEEIEAIDKANNG